MIFFDNQMNNCKTVSNIGVQVVYTPEGVTRKSFQVPIVPLVGPLPMIETKYLIDEFAFLTHLNN